MCSGSCGARVWPRISQNTHNTRVNGGACMRAFARTWCDCQFPRSLARPASHAALGSAFPRLRRRQSERTSPRSVAQSWRPRCDASVARSHRPSWRPGVLAVQTPPPLESPPRVDLPLSLAGVSSPHVSSLTPRHAICLAADALRMRDGQAAQATALRHAPFCRDLRAATTPGAHGDRVLGLRCRRRAATKRHACSLGPATAMKRNRLARAALANETARVMQCAGTRRCHLLNCCLLYIYASSQAHREPHRVVRMLRAIPAHRDAALPLLTECASIRLFPSCVISQAASIRGPVPDQLSSQPLPDLQLTEHAAQTSSSSSARSPFRVSPLTQLGILPKPQAASPARQASELLLQRLEVIP